MTTHKQLFLLAVISLGLAGASQAQIKVQNGQKVAFMGDSITQFGWDRTGGYVHLVAEALESAGVKIGVVPAGISGQTSRDMLARIDGLIKQKPDWMTLSCGVNDVWHGPGGIEFEPYKTNITALVDKAQAAGIKVVILTSTMIQESDNAFNQKLETYNAFLRQLAKERNLPLADLNALCWKVLKADKANHLTVDGVHMNPEGNMLMARGILETFGMTTAQIDAFEKTWRASPSAASILAQVTFKAMAPVSLKSYNALASVPREQKIAADQLQQTLLFESIRTVMKAHEQDAAFTAAQAQAEINTVFAQKIAEATK